ncbi:hypothetical protein DACRYDRAFT_23098, partial [Dacryopinax primogenitus]
MGWGAQEVKGDSGTAKPTEVFIRRTRGLAHRPKASRLERGPKQSLMRAGTF